MRLFFLLMIIFFVIGAGHASAMKGPWSVKGTSPVIEIPLQEQPRPESATNKEVLAAAPFLVLIKGFQRYISPVDGDRCNMYPSCSTYGLHAFRKHGVLKGLVLTADRLLHEYDEGAFAPRIIKSGKLRYYDPVEYNDFWWHK